MRPARERAMTEPVRIDPDAFYDDHSAGLKLGFQREALARARKAGELRFTKKAGRVLYRGSWLLAWLAGEPAGALA
jgi:hypothetical protein